MSAAGADRNLLYGILALQMDFISRDQLIAAMQAWVLDKTRSLGQVLLGQGALGEEDHEALDRLVDRHLARHGQDLDSSLASLPNSEELSWVLEQVVDSSLPTTLQGAGTDIPATTDERLRGSKG